LTTKDLWNYTKSINTRYGQNTETNTVKHLVHTGDAAL